MRIVFLKKNSLTIIGFFLALFILGFLIGYNPIWNVSNDFYQVAEDFPPLVFLPNYEHGPVVHASASILIEGKRG